MDMVAALPQSDSLQTQFVHSPLHTVFLLGLASALGTLTNAFQEVNSLCQRKLTQQPCSLKESGSAQKLT